MAHIAHITFNENDNEKSNPIIETVDEHCTKVAELAYVYGKAIGLETVCFIAGLLHDSGKRCNDFDGYILNENKIKRGDIDHSYAGVTAIIEVAPVHKNKTVVGELVIHGLCRTRDIDLEGYLRRVGNCIPGLKGVTLESSRGLVESNSLGERGAVLKHPV